MRGGSKSTGLVTSMIFKVKELILLVSLGFVKVTVDVVPNNILYSTFYIVKILLLMK